MRKEDKLLQAMNDIEERYINEVELPKKQTGKRTWVKWMGVAASIVIVAFVSTNLPKDVIDTPPTELETESTYSEIGEGELDRDWAEGPNGEMLLVISPYFEEGGMGGGGNISIENMKEADKNLPWKDDMNISALPIYENLAYHGPAGEPVYLTKEALLEKAENIAESLGVKLSSTAYRWTSEANVEKHIAAIVAKMELGEIEVEGNGSVYITFKDGVKPPEEYFVPYETSIEEANETVAYLVEHFSSLLKEDSLIPNAYVSYDLAGNRRINYRAVGSGEGKDNIEEYYFNQVIFYCDEEKGLTGLRFGDERETSEYLGEYPIITVEEAKELLKKGNFISNFGISIVEGETFTDDNIYDVTLEYRVLNTCEYFQPYYRFYVKLKDEWGYGMFYVPAVQESYLRNWD